MCAAKRTGLMPGFNFAEYSKANAYESNVKSKHIVFRHEQVLNLPDKILRVLAGCIAKMECNGRTPKSIKKYAATFVAALTKWKTEGVIVDPEVAIKLKLNIGDDAIRYFGLTDIIDYSLSIREETEQAIQQDDGNCDLLASGSGTYFF